MIDIRQSFRGREIFLTGANGFLGKVILAFLLDRIQDLNQLHILMRPAGDLSARQRFQADVLDSPPLKAIVERCGREFLDQRISVLGGELSAPGCGLSNEEISRLRGRVSLIINCAGRVDFFPPLDESFRSNVDGVENVIGLAKDWGAKLLHVSTCFVCGEADGLIEESTAIRGFYPHRRGPGDASFDFAVELGRARELIRQIDRPNGAGGLGDSGGSRRSRELNQRLAALGRQRAADWGWVNTYTYSKSLGEQVIAAEEGLEYAIVRPAIVESAWRFPFPGWIEGGRTSAPLVLMALGGQKDWSVREEAPLEVIPVDMVAAAILVVAAELLSGRHAAVYQLGSADVNPVELGSIIRWLDVAARSRPRPDRGETRAQALVGWLAGNRRGAKIRFVSEAEAERRREKREAGAARLERWAPSLARLLRGAGLPGSKPLEGLPAEVRKLTLQSRFREQTLGQYLPFVLENRYIFECENIRAAFASLSDEDRELLPWRPEAIDWKEYWIENQIEGIEKWVQPEAVREWTFRI